jgi:glycosyltransferase involved in cell wall biosynthesis
MSSIAIVTNSFSGGGAERSMNILANEFQNAGYETSLIAINSGPEDIVPRKCKTYCLGRNWKAGFSETLKSRTKFKELLNDLQPDSLIINCELPELLIALTSTKSKIIVVEHASDPWRGRKILGLVVRFILIAKRVKWVAVSSDLKFWPGLSKFSSVIKNPVVKDYLFPPSSNPKLIKSPKLVFIGRLSEEKQPGMFLDICRKTKIPGVIFGDGPLRSEIEDRVKTENIDIELRGFTTYPWAEVSDRDLVIVTSKNEGDGLVVAEAVMLGIPILLLDTPDLQRFDLPVNSYKKDVSDFCESINSQVENGFEINRVDSKIQNGLSEQRFLGKIFSQWLKIIYSN